MRSLGRIVMTLLAVLVAVIVVAFVALRRPDLPWDRLEAKYATPASKFMDLPVGGQSLHVHYRDQGDPKGPVLVMVHGFSANLDTWEPWVKRLGYRYRIITLDLPGHGLTRAPKGFAVGPDTFTEVIDGVASRLNAPRFVLIGNSMGGGAAWAYALKHPEHLAGLVLVDAAGWPHAEPGKGGAVVFKVLANPVGRFLIKDLDTRPLIRQGLEAAYLDKSLVTPALLDRYAELARAPGHRDILLGLQSGKRIEASDALLAQIKVPTLVMHGAQDKLIPFADGQKFARAIPGATLVAYPDGGHVPMEQIPDRSAADLKAWLEAKVYPPTTSPE